MSVARVYSYPVEKPATEKAPVRAVGTQLDMALRSKCLLLLIIVSLMAAFITFRSEALMRNGYALVLMKQQLTQLEKDNEFARLEIARLKSPQRIQQIATAEMGMVVPQQVYFAQAETQPVQGIGTKVAATRQAEEQGIWGKVLGLFGQTGKAEAASRSTY